MQKDQVYTALSKKSPKEFADAFAAEAGRNGFVIHNEATMDMGHSFAHHGVEVGGDFDLHMIQICKPEKAAKSLSANAERAILMPKFIMAFSREGKTQIRFLRYSAEDISAVVDDAVFPASLAETYGKICNMIDAAK